MKKQIATVITTFFVTFIILQNAALTTVTINPVQSGYEVSLFGATVTK